uniref:CD99 antigen-like protein 2 n=1 Tax=Phascolarctos cinereus TaxID=38626 RepID=A0A6P5JI37_PHACI|nr:CD99 antigen-like protein 2 [Phascolarctos cinereus]
MRAVPEWNGLSLGEHSARPLRSPISAGRTPPLSRPAPPRARRPLSRPAPRRPRSGHALRVRLPLCVRVRARRAGSAIRESRLLLPPAPPPLLSGRRLSSLSRVLARLLVLSGPLLHLPLTTCSPAMLCGGPARFLALAFTSALLLHGGAGKSLKDGLDESNLGFELSDALPTTTNPPLKKTGIAKGLRFDLTDSLYERIERLKRGSGKPNQKSKAGFELSDALPTTTNPPLKKTDFEDLGFHLSDALDEKNDGFNGGGGRPNLKPGEGLTDKDLEDILEDGYKPDKGKGDGRYESNDDPGAGTIAETGTIAGIASALAMALIGAVSSYISYQQKKFCFNIQQGEEGVNTDYVKGQSLEGVSTEEPQVKYSALQTQSAEKPSQETPKI